MSGTYVFEKPLGMRDVLPDHEQVNQTIKNQMAGDMEKWGYRFLSTPTLEYYDTVGKASAIDEERLFKLLDAEGRTVVLRPDMTVPIARVAASSMKQDPLPLRLAYMSPVFRKQEFEAGRPAEFEQIGVELIGDGSTDADAEVIALMVQLFRSVGLKTFNVTIGDVSVVNALLEESAEDPELIQQLRQRLYEKNDVGFREDVEAAELNDEAKKRLLAFIDMRHLDMETALETLPFLFPGEKGLYFKQKLNALLAILNAYGVAKDLDIDLTLVSHSEYYTGIVFEGYSGKSGFPIGSGGRYDDLLDKFQRPAPATGFGLRLNLLAEALEETSAAQPQQCVIYSEDQKEDALKKALELRQLGHNIVLQHAAAISDLKTYLSQFQKVYEYISETTK